MNKYGSLKKTIGTKLANRLLHDEIIKKYKSRVPSKRCKRRTDSMYRLRLILDDEFGFEPIGPKALPNPNGSSSLKIGAAALLILAPALANAIRLKVKYGSVFAPTVDYIKKTINDIKSGRFKGKIVEIRTKLSSMIKSAFSKSNASEDPNAKQLSVSVVNLKDASIRKSIKKVNRIVSKRADKAISRRAIRHNDIIPLAVAPFVAKAIPVLVSLLKAGAIAGIAKTISDPLKERIVKPLLDRILGHFKKILANKDADESYVKTIWLAVKNDLKLLANTLKKEKSALFGKVNNLAIQAEGIA